MQILNTFAKNGGGGLWYGCTWVHITFIAFIFFKLNLCSLHTKLTCQMSVCLLGSNLQNKAHRACTVFELLKYSNMNLSAGETDPEAKKAFDLFKVLICCSFPQFPNSQMWKHSISHEMIKMLQMIESLLPALISIAAVSRVEPFTNCSAFDWEERAREAK